MNPVGAARRGTTTALDWRKRLRVANRLAYDVASEKRMLRGNKPMIQHLDHLVILVDDLAQAVTDYTTLGFTVTPGGEHSDGATHNALVAFADGTYLELIAFKRASPGHRWWRHTAYGEGLIDFALLPSDTAEVIADARKRGLFMQGPTDGGRVRPDGVELRWQTGLPPTPDLPFLCGDLTPRTLRVPSGAAHIHANHAQGIAALAVVVADLDTSATRYAALMGRPADRDGTNHGIAERAWTLDANEIVLTTPTAPHDEVDAMYQRRLTGRGEGPAAFAVRTDQNRDQRELDQSLTHGVPIALV